MIEYRTNRQFLAMQGDRLLGRSFLSASSPAAGKQAAPEVTPPAFGAAALSDSVRVVLRLVSEAEQISDGEVISRAVCHYAHHHVGLPALLGDFDRSAVNRHANRPARDAEAKGTGFDTKAIRTLIRLRKMDQAERAEAEGILDLYKAALGMA